MSPVDYPQIEKLHAAAKRERAEYVYCLFRRIVLWIRTRLPHADASLRDMQCCPSA